MNRFELNDGTSAKFWEAGVKGSTLTVRFGRIGTAGQSKDKVLGSAEEAAKEWAKLIKEKIGKGYVLASAAAAPVPAAPVPAAPAAVADTVPQAAIAVVAHGPERTAALRPDEGGAKLFSAAALPTRTRPGPPFDPARDWAEFCRLLLELLPLAAAEQDAMSAYVTNGREDFRDANWVDQFCRAHPGMEQRMRELGGDKEGRYGVKVSRAEILAFRDAIPLLQAEAAERRQNADAWLRDRLANAPAPAGAADARLWATHLLVTCPDMGGRDYDKPVGNHRPACHTSFTHFARWLAASSGAPAMIATLDRLRPTPMGRHDTLPTSPWDMVAAVGLRAALPSLPEADYEAVVAACLQMHEANGSRELATFLAFILADDRPDVRHALQAGAVLLAYVGPESSYDPSRRLIPLIADLPPSAAAPWRARKDVAFKMGACDVSVAEGAATLVAVAHGAGELAAPSLAWFMRDLTGADRALVARALLETREDGALASLLPFMGHKQVRDAVDAAERAYPAWTFGQVLRVVAGRDDVALTGRIVTAVERHGADAARAWAGEAGRPAAACLERILARRETPFAPSDTWPPFLRDPPWQRKRTQHVDVVLDLAPIPTPFGHGFAANAAVPRDTYQWRSSKVLADLGELGPFIHTVETNTDLWDRGPRLAASEMPALDAPAELILQWLRRRLDVDPELGRVTMWRYKEVLQGVAWQPEPLSLVLWDMTGALSGFYMSWNEVIAVMVARFGTRAVPGLMKLVEAHLSDMMPRIAAVDAAEIAPVAARTLLRVKRARVAATDWLRRHPRTAAMRLLPDALGPPGLARDAAERALRWLIADRPDHRAILDAAVAEYAVIDSRVTGIVAQGLFGNSLDRVPAKPPKVPAWVQAQGLSRPVLRSGGALPGQAVSAVVEMALFSSPLVPYAGMDALREACTPESLDAFAFDLLQAWSGAGSLPSGEWALHAAATLGGDRCARDVTRLVRAWAAKGWRPRALAGIDALAAIGSDVALINLKAIADKNPSDVIRGHAQDRIAEAGDARGLSPDELADRLTPDLGLDERGGLDLDFGPRRFRVGFDEFLHPWVRDEAGQRLRILPRPGKADDAALAIVAAKLWASLKKDAEAVAKLQVSRLEAMLATSRRLQPDTFWRFFATHPLLRHLAGRLVWGVFDATDPREGPLLTFRVAEDLGLTDADDAPVAPDLSEGAPVHIGLVHPLHLASDALARWAALFGEYEIAQPFPQLTRETYALTGAEAALAHTDRFKGAVVAGRRLRGLRSQGWPLDAGGESAHQLLHQLVLPDGKAAYATLDFSPGLRMGRGGDDDEPQTLGTLSLRASGGADDAPLLGALDRVTASELLRAPSLLAALGDG